MKRQEMIHRENTPAQELELHPEEVREKTDTYVSLTELYGVDIFTKEFGERKTELILTADKEEIEIEKQLFVLWNGEVGIREDELSEHLFKTQNTEAYLPSYKTTYKAWGITEVIMIGVPVAIVLAIYILFSVDKKRR